MANNYNKQLPRCSFCGKEQTQVERLIAGPSVFICNECVELCNSILEDELSFLPDELPDRKRNAFKLPLPTELKKSLDEYVIGQEKAKRALSVAVYNHYK